MDPRRISRPIGRTTRSRASGFPRRVTAGRRGISCRTTRSGVPADTMAEEVRVFMGRRLDCAQCHNHPYENWSQDQFWGMAAFFGRLFRIGQVVVDHPTNMDLGSKDVGGSIDLLHPRTKARSNRRCSTTRRSHVTPDGNPRKELADWMTSHPYFAEAAVNRIWGHFFARGIVDPVDDFRSTNPPTHPELLAALAEDFRSHGYDLRHLMKTIVSSRTYQLSHRAERHQSRRRDQLFAFSGAGSGCGGAARCGR